MFQRFFYSLILICAAVAASAQRTAIKDSAKPGTQIIYEHADRFSRQIIDSFTYLTLVGKARVRQDKTRLQADSIVLDVNNNIAQAYGNVFINDADSVFTYAQYVKYLGKEKKAYLKNAVKLTDGKGTITTDDMDYDTGIKMGSYHNGGKVVNGKTTLTSKDGYYYGDTRDVYFYNRVEMIDPETKIFTDTLLYNLNTEITSFVSTTTIFTGNRRIVTKSGFYDVKNKKAQFAKRTLIEDSAATIIADDMAMEDSTGRGEFRGNAVYRSKDSINGYDLIANLIMTDKKKNTILATEKPILFIKQKLDTIYVTADTLFSAKQSDLQKAKKMSFLRDTAKGKTFAELDKDSSNDRYFEAYRNVKIFHDSLQAVADSMFYSSVDSVFRLFTNPIVWAQDNQITGDTMYLFVKNRNPEKLIVFEHAMAISKLNDKYFNQLQGNSIVGLFKNGKIDILKTKGSPAQNVYYAQDEQNRLVGVNQSRADAIHVEFLNDKPNRVLFINDLNGTMFPLNQVNHKEIQVKGFKWLVDLQPKTKFDILGN